MEFLKAIFGDKSLTYGELSAALANSKDVKLANLAEGKHVDKEKYSALEARNKTPSEQLAKLGEVNHLKHKKRPSYAWSFSMSVAPTGWGGRI